MIGRILLTLTGLAVSGLLLLVLIGLWDRYEEETAALGFGGIYERYLASQAGFSVDLKGRAAPEAERRPQIGTAMIGKAAGLPPCISFKKTGAAHGHLSLA
jgi:hypothetical protein